MSEAEKSRYPSSAESDNPQVGSRFCPGCPALLVLVRQPSGQIYEHAADPNTGAAGARHVCQGRA